ncbi:MAG: hypothetical protein ACLFUU_03090 [Desulfobacteraceae bacterium]
MTSDWLQELPILAFFAIVLSLSTLFIMSEVAASFQWKGLPPFRVLFNRWALLLYGIYGGITLLLAFLLIERQVLSFSLSWAVLLGLGGPQLLKLKLSFTPLSDSKDKFQLSFEELFSRFRLFCFTQIQDSLANRRLKYKARQLQRDERELINHLEVLCPAEEYQNLLKLIDERRQKAPLTIKSFLVDLIERYDPNFPSQR